MALTGDIKRELFRSKVKLLNNYLERHHVVFDIYLQ